MEKGSENEGSGNGQKVSEQDLASKGEWECGEKVGGSQSGSSQNGGQSESRVSGMVWCGKGEGTRSRGGQKMKGLEMGRKGYRKMEQVE